jgi:voltage-gated potassium channel Kch
VTPLAAAIAVTSCTILIHATAMTGIVRFVRRERRLKHAGVHLWEDVLVVAAVAFVALAAHMLEIAVWAGLFERCREFTNFASAFYSSAENYTTLGYGDVVMSAPWKLLGPLEAADGMLMFGITTAMIFAVIHHLVIARLGPPQ